MSQHVPMRDDVATARPDGLTLVDAFHAAREETLNEGDAAAFESFAMQAAVVFRDVLRTRLSGLALEAIDGVVSLALARLFVQHPWPQWKTGCSRAWLVKRLQTVALAELRYQSAAETARARHERSA
ncbi:MAG: hypothetical protein KDB53_18465 [Planctomycetes bacterium]|nr:hypothetical protein [Planctomycetota bacterium]